jgi:hypothetical protein
VFGTALHRLVLLRAANLGAVFGVCAQQAVVMVRTPQPPKNPIRVQLIWHLANPTADYYMDIAPKEG